ncbi:MAG: hypothetical protein U0232_08315 [Thermomicrobiales bacterium]
MGEMEQIQAGMPVYLADGQELGTVREYWGSRLYINNDPIPLEMVDLVLDHGVYLKGNFSGFSGAGDAFDEGVIRVAARSEEAVAAQGASFIARRTQQDH